MRCVAFMRNVNQGQRGHPSTEDIVAGFADAGCPEVRPFQSNGTIVFDADDAAHAARVVSEAGEAIAARSGHEREILWLALPELEAIVHEHGADPQRCELTLHAGGTIPIGEPEIEALGAQHRCAFVDAGPGWVLVRNDVAGEGRATPVLERITRERATSRGLPTIVRLVSRFA